MNKIMANIRAVPGVVGTIAIDKKRALTYQLLPGNYDSDSVKRIALPMLKLGRSLDKNLVVDLFFFSGKARFYNRSEAAVLILGRDELNFDILGGVCKEAIPAICRKFARSELSDSGIAKESGSHISFELMLKSINIIASNVQQRIGAYLVTKHLRNAKDELVKKYQFLNTMIVDNNGVVSLIKGYPPHKGDDLLSGYAHWANLFLAKCAKSSDKLRPEDILSLTIEIKDKLEMTGFYQLYADIGL